MQLLSLIKDAKSILIVCHKKPDGDTLGAGFALWQLCRALSKPADIAADTSHPPPYGFIPDFDALNRPAQKKYDLVFAVDCAEAARMGKFADYAQSAVCVNIDHHKTNDYFGKHNYVIPELSSTCEALYGLLKKEGVFAAGAFSPETVKKIAYSLFVGLSTDTGHFMHSSVTAQTFITAAELAATGIDFHRIGQSLYRANSVQKTKLIAAAIQSMRFFRNDEICVLTVSLADIEKTGCLSSDTEGLIDFGMNISAVQVAVLITQQNEKLYKVSFRSKGLDVSNVAGVFGGGGHVRASGCIVSGYYEDVVDKVVKAVTDFM
ncbi:MAG: bifunctional oligoribonuclease/PAP phosphatase NrnA [Firmicutes bacterium]|nr:bifunctional oligoribonuclease/PAP phosphatase NrnA [Bacillota bacterium]